MTGPAPGTRLWTRAKVKWARVRLLFWARPGWVRSLLVALPVVCLYILWINSLPKPQLLTTVSALTERVEFVVTNPAQAVIPIENMSLFPEPSEGLAGCVSGTLRPQEGAVIAYERLVTGEPSVSLVSGKAVFEQLGGRSATFFEGVDFGRKGCDGSTTPRFPIWGQVRLGDEKFTTSGTGRLSPSMLLEGTMTVQARSIESPLLFFKESTLYPVTQLNLPIAARVEAATPAARTALWWGSAYVDPQKVALQVQLATEAPALRVFRPGRTAAADADVISVTALTQVFSDPNMVRFQAFLAAVLALFSHVSSLVGRRKEE